MLPAVTYSINEMSALLELSDTWVSAHISPQFVPDPAGRYSADCYESLRHQAKHLLSLPPLGVNYTYRQAADKLLCSRATVVRLVAANGLPKKRYRARDNRAVWGISRRSIGQLRRLLVPYAPASMISLPNLRLATGWDQHTARRRLRLAGLKPQEYRDAFTGLTIGHYPKDRALAVLGRRPQLAPGGASLTLTAMARGLGRHTDWVRFRLERQPMLAAQVENRRDDTNRIRPHYSRTVYLELKRQSDLQRQSKLARAS